MFTYKPKNYRCLNCDREQYTNIICYGCEGTYFEDLLCKHPKVAVAFAAENPPLSGFSGKDLVVYCVYCQEEMSRTSVVGKKVLNFLPSQG